MKVKELIEELKQSLEAHQRQDLLYREVCRLNLALCPYIEVEHEAAAAGEGDEIELHEPAYDAALAQLPCYWCDAGARRRSVSVVIGVSGGTRCAWVPACAIQHEHGEDA